MFERNLISELRDWAAKPGHKPLVLRGARQVGKSTLANQFGEEYDVYLKLNLELSAHADLFRHGYTIQEILPLIYYLNRKERIAGKTLLFIDEIQACPEAVAALRYFYEEAPDIDVIAAGSLLESLIDKHISFPVGRVEYKAVRPCSFLEYLEARGQSSIRNALASGENLNGIHSSIEKEFETFALIGGMPEIVAHYCEHQDILALGDIYESLLIGYRDDVEKYASGASQTALIRHILTAGWWEAGGRITFEKFGHSAYRSKDMSNAFKILGKTMLLELVYPTVSTKLPIIPSFGFSPKLFWLDTGIVNYAGKAQEALLKSTDISDVWSGRIAEHIIGQELIGNNSRFSASRAFWTGGSKSTAEVDFVIQYNDMELPIEVKSGNNSKLKSLHVFMDKAPHDIAVRFWHNPERTDIVKTDKGKQYRLISLPFYYAGILDKTLDRIMAQM